MTLLIPSASKKLILDFQLGVATPGNQQLRLFTNSYVPVDTDTLVNYTEMTAVLGYTVGGKTLTKTSWVDTASGTGIPANAVYPVQTFTFTAGTAVTVYGYMVVDVTTGLLLWAEAFASSKTVQNNGDQIIITPTITYTHS